MEVVYLIENEGFLEENDVSLTETDETTREKNVWNTNETLALIEAYRCHKNEFSQCRKRKMVWDKISTFLLGLQVIKSPKACEVKWKNLVRTYKNVKDNNNKTGRGVSRFTFYDQMDEILGDKPSTNCDHTCNAGAKSYINEDAEDSESTETQLYVSEESTDTQKSDSETPIKRRRVNYYQELLKTKTEMMIQKDQYEKEKAINRERKIEFKKQEREKKERREERKMDLLEKQLAIEERKVLALEAYLAEKSKQG